MAARMTKDAVIAQASTLKLVWLLALVSVVPNQETIGQSSYQQQQADQQQLAGQHYLHQQQELQQRQQQEQQWRESQQELARQSDEQWQRQQASLRQADELQAEQRQSQVWQDQQDAQQRRRDEEDSTIVPADSGVEAAPSATADAPALNRNNTVVNAPTTSAVPSTTVFWTVAASSLLLVGLALGAIATWLVLYGRRDAQPSSGQAFHASEVVGAIRSRLLARKIRLMIRMRRAARRSKSRLRAMIPTRRTVLRIVCLLVGTALVGLSLVGFTSGRIWESSILLPIGYFIAASYWLLAWKRRPSGPDVEELEYLAAASEPPSLAPRPAAIRPQVAVRERTTIHTPPPPHVEFSIHTADKPSAADTVDNLAAAETVDNLSASVAFQPSNPLPAGYAAQLHCAACRKQFNVRGQGEITFRLVPCPACGSPMESLGPKRADIIPNDPNWVPIVSVACKSCRSLIDVPYATFGTSIPCPRCQAEMLVPSVTPHHLEQTRSEPSLA